MMVINKILTLLSIILITTLLVSLFVDRFIYKRFKEKSLYKYLGSGIFVLALIITIGFLIIRSDNVVTKYYQDPNYWHSYIQYKNDRITKIKNPTLVEFMAIYDNWKIIEEINYEVEFSSGVLKIRNPSLILEFKNVNDTVIRAKYRNLDFENEFKYSFNSEGNIIEYEMPNEKLYYEYDNYNRLIKYIEFSNGEELDRHTIEYSNNDYVVSFFAQQESYYGKMEVKHNKDGLPIGSYFTAKDDPDFLINHEFSYQGEIRTDIFYEKYPGTENQTKNIVGKGLETQREVKITEGTSIEYRYKYDQHGNWIISLSYQNNVPFWLVLRKITYQDRSISGTIDTTNLDINNLYLFDN